MGAGIVSGREATRQGLRRAKPVAMVFPLRQSGAKSARYMGRVLVVDDEPAVRSFLAEALEADGHKVEAAADGFEAEALLAQQAFEVVVTDLRMPGPDGLSLLERSRQRAPEMQVILVTAHASVESAVQAMKGGAFDYVEKPLEGPSALRRLVRRAIERSELLRLTRGAKPASGASLLPTLGYGDPAMSAVEKALAKVARTNATVLLLGETGTGKEVAARALHAASANREGAFVAVNCASLNEGLLENELFGHEKGAFTGAHSRHRGRLEVAEGGTFFLDEVGELAPALQAKLLRVLQEGQFERVGGTESLPARVRWVAATNRDLPAMIEAGCFREDLYHRLAVFPVRLPALRERPLDLAPLTDRLLPLIASELGVPPLHLSAAGRSWLASAELRGNIRELRNRLKRAAILADDSRIGVEHLAAELPGAPAAGRGPSNPAKPPTTLGQYERAAIAEALERTGGNRKLAAERLGIGVRTLYEKLKRYRLS